MNFEKKCLRFSCIQVNGERSPSEVYQDFRASVFDTLSKHDNQEAAMNGISGIGHNADDIPGSIGQFYRS